MNNDIKEILDNINNKYEDYYVHDIVSGSDLKQLSDYISNLQKYYNENVNQYEELLVKYNAVQRWYHLRKSRNEKAIELIHKAMAESDITGNGTLNLNDLLNILEGYDKE